MCCGSERQKPAHSSSPSTIPFDVSITMNRLTVETQDTFASLLELAANNDVEGFRRSIEHDPSSVDEAGLWYGRQKGSKLMVTEQRTPLMVAATYGSIDVAKLILDLSSADPNQPCGLDGSTALHCAASGGADNAIDVVKLLLASGADPNLVDGNGHYPVDVVVVPPKLQCAKSALEELLRTNSSISDRPMTISTQMLNSNSNSNSPPLSLSSENGSLFASDLHSPFLSERKEYPIDPSLPDIKNSIYSTDEFRMYSFKVRHCSRAYSHDWTECPFVHPGENARRRDPRKFHYSCVPCPEFRKGACRRGDMCEYAHGVFECWLHPAQYRTRLCKDGTSCARRVCFFAHTPEELRPLYVSTGSAMLPGSPSSVSAMSPSQFTPPMSPAGNGMPHSTLAWPQPNVPALHLPGSNLQSSRLRSSFSARDVPMNDFEMLQDFDMLSLSSNPLNRSGRMKILTPSNLDDIFSAEGSSPRFSPTHKSAVINQFQNMLSPINTNFSSPRNMEPISPMSARVSMLAREKQQQFRSLSSRELGSSAASVIGSPVHSWSKWGSSDGKPDWAVSSDELGKLQRSSSFENTNNGDEPDLSWVQSLVKESPSETKENSAVQPSGVAENASIGEEQADNAVIGAWLEQMQLDHLVAQQN